MWSLLWHSHYKGKTTLNVLPTTSSMEILVPCQSLRVSAQLLLSLSTMANMYVQSAFNSKYFAKKINETVQYVRILYKAIKSKPIVIRWFFSAVFLILTANYPRFFFKIKHSKKNWTIQYGHSESNFTWERQRKKVVHSLLQRSNFGSEAISMSSFLQLKAWFIHIQVLALQKPAELMWAQLQLTEVHRTSSWKPNQSVNKAKWFEQQCNLAPHETSQQFRG